MTDNLPVTKKWSQIQVFTLHTLQDWQDEDTQERIKLVHDALAGELLGKILKKDPESRLSMKEIIEDAYFEAGKLQKQKKLSKQMSQKFVATLERSRESTSKIVDIYVIMLLISAAVVMVWVCYLWAFGVSAPAKVA